MAGNIEIKRARAAAACPFCSLLCDDLKVALSGNQSLRVERNGCDRADSMFARAPIAPAPMIRGAMTTLSAAADECARLLRAAKAPLIGGLATDIDGIRRSIEVAERTGATLDHANGDSLAVTTRILQSRGWYSTTLSEIRNRADLVVLVDVDLKTRYANFTRRCLLPSDALESKRRDNRQIWHLGRASAIPDELKDHDNFHALRTREIGVALSTLSALVNGTPPPAAVSGGSRKALTALAEAMQQSQYCVLVFAAGQMAAPADSTISAICDLVDQLNKTTRAACFPLGGDSGGQSATATCSWLTGFPLRVTLGRQIQYLPEINRCEDLLEAQRSDLLMWIDAFGEHGTPPPAANLKQTIMLSTTRSSKAREAAVYIPVGTPGIDHFARLIRADGVVTMPMPQLRECGLPSVASVMNQILDRV